MPGRARRGGGLQSAASQPEEMDIVPESPPQGESAVAQDSDEREPSEESEVAVQRVRILPGSSEKAASFEFLEEGHTLGNALRWIIMKNPDVEFCAYSIPHPSEAKMNVRIQTYEGTAVDALQKGLKDLGDVCDVIAEEFTTKIQGRGR